ncbi:MAG: transcription-repair coupling factor [Spartobacteria bacterium]|nr:transcription-repair coupling factor [Spartobacteria bacterium]
MNNVSVLHPSHENQMRKYLQKGVPFYVQAPTVSASAFLAVCLARIYPACWVWIADSMETLEQWAMDAATLLGDDAASLLLLFPPAHWGRDGRSRMDAAGERMRTLSALGSSSEKRVVGTCLTALLETTLSPQEMMRHSLSFCVGKEYGFDALGEKLELMGYSFTHEVVEAGEGSIRGGLIDVWPAGMEWPVRIEFFGDEVESIRLFNPTDQCSIEKLDRVALSPMDDACQEDDQYTCLLHHLPTSAQLGWIHYELALEQLQIQMAAPLETSAAYRLLTLRALQREFSDLFERSVLVGEVAPEVFPGLGRPCIADAEFDYAERMPACDLDGVPHPDFMEHARREYLDQLAASLKVGKKALIYFETEGSRARFVEYYGSHLDDAGEYTLHVGSLSEGFVYRAADVIVLAESDIYGYRRVRRSRKAGGWSQRAASGAQVTEWMDLVPGEFVVHIDHGIGKYLGLYEMNFNGALQEVLAVEYAEQARLFVSIDQVHLLSQYIGVGGSRPEMSKLGSKRWARQKEQALDAVEDLSSGLLTVQAERSTLEGYAFSDDTVWQQEFEQSFPFVETYDQMRAISEIKGDMTSTRPMDRLLCGDVGYGKTEVAMRAAFRAVMDGKQVGILVPTTVLAQQHFYTFTERMAAFPVRVEMLSRFRTKAEQSAIIKQLSAGSVDILIGTHRLLQNDIQFKDLGLVIIDEEQRFGVKHKEFLKNMRHLVDVLTMTATPIPRTLYMSLAGARDMSTIQTPPQERMAVETVVSESKPEIIRQAILREIQRDGQVFFLHNSVMDIASVHMRLQELVPEAKSEFAHGQMSEKQLSSIMRRFSEGKFQVLLCTTIIESGIDIPNVNTIIINQADRFGLAQLYQLRGRVGRSNRQAYAYLLLPRHKQLFESARKRISAIKRYTSLGAGFKLALRDLEIRGAGNILGAQQSGHIAAIGFDLYCQLLRQSIARKQGKNLPPLLHTVEFRLDFISQSPHGAEQSQAAALPYDYIEDENHRVQVYRQMSTAVTEAEMDEIEKMLRDRFGPVPEALNRLLWLSKLRICAARNMISVIESKDGKVMMTRNGAYLMLNKRHWRLNAMAATDRLREIIHVIHNHFAVDSAV